MSDQLWTVTHATAEGQLRWWTVDDETELERIEAFMAATTDLVRMHFASSTGYVLIWLTPGQSLTVEKSR